MRPGLRSVILLATAVSICSAIVAAYLAWYVQSMSVPMGGSIHDLNFTVQTDKSAYAQGEAVLIMTNLTNKGAAPVTLSYGDSCGGALTILTADGTPLFNNRQNRPCFQVVTEVTIVPGQSIARSYLWGQEDFLGHPVPANHWYEILAAEGAIVDSGVSVLGHGRFFIGPPA